MIPAVQINIWKGYPVADFIYNCCPVCGSNKNKRLGSTDHGQAISGVPADAGIAKCLECRSVFANPLPVWSAEDFAAMYSNTYFENERPTHDRNIDVMRRFRLIEKYREAEVKHLLEFGAGIFAGMAEYAAKKGFNVDIQEPSESFYSVLKQKFPNSTVFNCGVLDMAKEGKNLQYSVIYSDAVMEHVPNPNDYFKKIADLLVPGGVFYFVCPNEHSFKTVVQSAVLNLCGRNTAYLPPYKNPYHLIGYSKRGTQLLAEECGLKLMIHKKGHDYLATYFLRKGPKFFPAAVVLFIADKIGLSTNQEFLLIKQ